MPKPLNVLAKVSELCKRRGFVIERCAKNVVGHGVDNLLDYGPLGVEMKRNVGNGWWHEIVTSRDNIYGVDLSMVDLAQTNFTRGVLKSTETDTDAINIYSYLCEICRHASDHMESYGFKMPFGLAQYVRMFTKENEDIDQFIFRSHQKEFLKLCFFCPPNKLNFWMDYWMRKRLSWWKKYADMPVGFALSDSASTRLFCQENNSSFTDTVAVEVIQMRASFFLVIKRKYGKSYNRITLYLAKKGDLLLAEEIFMKRKRKGTPTIDELIATQERASDATTNLPINNLSANMSTTNIVTSSHSATEINRPYISHSAAEINRPNISHSATTSQPNINHSVTEINQQNISHSATTTISQPNVCNSATTTKQPLKGTD